jgi:hypothetical protein
VERGRGGQGDGGYRQAAGLARQAGDGRQDEQVGDCQQGGDQQGGDGAGD